MQICGTAASWADMSRLLRLEGLLHFSQCLHCQTKQISISKHFCICCPVEYAYPDHVQKNSQTISNFGIDKKHILFT